MRLPDEGDRALVGKAAGLTDPQVEELARLERGVAAVSQSDWLEPVLCKVDKFEDEKPLKERFQTDVFTWEDGESKAIRRFLTTALEVEHLQLTKEEVDVIRKWSGGLGMSEKGRRTVERVLEGNRLDEKEQLALVLYAGGDKLKAINTRAEAIAEMTRILPGRYLIEESSEVIRHAAELFVRHFPLNLFLNDAAEQAEKTEKEDKPV